jgi:hypothetical protein
MMLELLDELKEIDLFEMSLGDFQAEIMHLSTISTERASYIFMKGGQPIDKERSDISYGTARKVTVPVEKIASMAIEKGADEVFSIHNHPSTQLLPSYGDLKVAHMLRSALGSIRLRNFIVAGENTNAQGTDFVKPSWVEFDLSGSIIDKYVTPGKEDKITGVRIKVPARTLVFNKTKRGETLRDDIVNAVKQTDKDGKFYYGFRIGSQIYWAKEADVEIL